VPCLPLNALLVRSRCGLGTIAIPGNGADFTPGRRDDQAAPPQPARRRHGV